MNGNDILCKIFVMDYLYRNEPNIPFHDSYKIVIYDNKFIGCQCDKDSYIHLNNNWYEKRVII